VEETQGRLRVEQKKLYEVFGCNPAKRSFTAGKVARIILVMNLTAALSTAKTAFDLARSLQNGLAIGQVKPEEVPARLMELQQHILSMQAIVHDLAEENRGLNEEVSDLKRCADFGKEFTFDEGVYWYRDYPYCPNCWDSDRKPIRLDGPYASNSETSCHFNCPQHKSKYYVKVRPHWRG
jgi:hypothetical protein